MTPCNTCGQMVDDLRDSHGCDPNQFTPEYRVGQCVWFIDGNSVCDGLITSVGEFHGPLYTIQNTKTGESTARIEGGVYPKSVPGRDKLRGAINAAIHSLTIQRDSLDLIENW